MPGAPRIARGPTAGATASLFQDRPEPSSRRRPLTGRPAGS